MTRLEKMVDTPTTAELKGKRVGRKANGYIFTLTEGQMLRAIAKGVPGTALMALAAITGAAYGGRQADWVTLSPRTLACFPHNYRWWHRATTALEVAGLVECKRNPGRMPRYRLAKAGQVTKRRNMTTGRQTPAVAAPRFAAAASVLIAASRVPAP